MDECCLKSLKPLYDKLNKEEREVLIKRLEEQMEKFYYRIEEKKQLIKYLKEAEHKWIKKHME